MRLSWIRYCKTHGIRTKIAANFALVVVAYFVSFHFISSVFGLCCFLFNILVFLTSASWIASAATERAVKTLLFRFGTKNSHTVRTYKSVLFTQNTFLSMRSRKENVFLKVRREKLLEETFFLSFEKKVFHQLDDAYVKNILSFTSHWLECIWSRIHNKHTQRSGSHTHLVSYLVTWPQHTPIYTTLIGVDCFVSLFALKISFHSTKAGSSAFFFFWCWSNSLARSLALLLCWWLYK